MPPLPGLEAYTRAASLTFSAGTQVIFSDFSGENSSHRSASFWKTGWAGTSLPSFSLTM